MTRDTTGSARAERAAEMLRIGEEAVERGDREAGMRRIAEFWHEDGEGEPLIAGVEGTATYRGRDGLREFLEDLSGAFEVRYLDPRFREIADTVVFLSKMEARGRESGVVMEIELGVVYRFDGDLIRWGKAYDSHEAALAAAEELARA